MKSTTKAQSALSSSAQTKLTFDDWNPGQRRAISVMRGPQLHTLLYGGGRSGKTFLVVKQIVNRAIRSTQPSRHLITRLRNNHVRASIWLDTFPKVMRLCFPGVGVKQYRQDGFVEVKAGTGESQIWFGGLDDKDRVDKILGQEYATIYPGECSQIPYSSIVVLRTRLAQSNTGLKLRAFYDLNPVGMKHWTYVEFVQKLDPLTRVALPNPEDFAYCVLNPKDNSANLDPTYLKSLSLLPGKYRKRFWEGEYVVEVDGALWTFDIIEAQREDTLDPKDAKFKRCVVAVDPSGASNKEDKRNDDIGIVCAGLGDDMKATVLEDATIKDGPRQWGLRAVATYRKWKADVIVAESNFGGEMVRSTIHAVDPNVPVKLVNASRGKHVRADPVSALYADNKVRHAGRFPELEEEMCNFSQSGYMGSRSPNRADALVWAITELMLGENTTGLLDYYGQLVAQMKKEKAA